MRDRNRNIDALNIEIRYEDRIEDEDNIKIDLKKEIRKSNTRNRKNVKYTANIEDKHRDNNNEI